MTTNWTYEDKSIHEEILNTEDNVALLCEDGEELLTENSNIDWNYVTKN
jgi:hypothetical protein